MIIDTVIAREPLFFLAATEAIFSIYALAIGKIASSLPTKKLAGKRSSQ
jgi:hypothetical protein